MWLFDVFRKKISTPRPVASAAIQQGLNLERLDRYFKSKLAGPGIDYSGISKDLSPFDIAKTALVEQVQNLIQREKQAAEKAGRSPNYEPILRTAIRLNQQLENGTYDGPAISRSDFMMRPSVADYQDRKSRFRDRFWNDYFSKMDATPIEKIPEKVSAGSVLGMFGLSTSSLHTVLNDLLKQCSKAQRQEQKVTTERKV